jgi:hypothetical protein
VLRDEFVSAELVLGDFVSAELLLGECFIVFSVFSWCVSVLYLLVSFIVFNFCSA